MTTVEAPLKRWTVEEMLELPDWERYELIDGELREESMGWAAAETTSVTSARLTLHALATGAGSVASETMQ